jgi:propanediol dehydratase small subunit
MSYGIKDYPLAEKHPDQVKGARGRLLKDITLDAVLAGDVTIEDLRITPTALHSQASIAQAAGRPRLADNFERASELVNVPQDVVMRSYELLRPGRAKSRQELLELAAELRTVHKSERIAKFIEEAADVYEKRGLFSKRY